jgi:hypothetical protein
MRDRFLSSMMTVAIAGRCQRGLSVSCTDIRSGSGGPVLKTPWRTDLQGI